MEHILIILIIVFGMSTAVVSCKKSEKVVEKGKAEETQSAPHEKESLAQAMKKASLGMRRLARAVENNDWVEMDMWTQELKEGIGYNCVLLYIIENSGIPTEFITLSNQFNSAINKLILCSKEHDTDNTDLEFNNLIKSCDACHERFSEKEERQLQFTGID